VHQGGVPGLKFIGGFQQNTGTVLYRVEVCMSGSRSLRDQPKTFFLEGIHKLVDRWTKCIEKEGDYVEK
jgi:hypothetical protein